MADDQITIFNEDPVTSPKSYTLPPNLGFVPTAITALFDGSGAASAYLACLSFKTQDDHLLARTFPEVAVPAGGSAEVTFAPF